MIGWIRRLFAPRPLTIQEQYIQNLERFFADRKKQPLQTSIDELTLRRAYAALRRKVSSDVIRRGFGGYHTYVAAAVKEESANIRINDQGLAFKFLKLAKEFSIRELLDDAAWNEMLRWQQDQVLSSRGPSVDDIFAASM